MLNGRLRRGFVLQQDPKSGVATVTVLRNSWDEPFIKVASPGLSAGPTTVYSCIRTTDGLLRAYLCRSLAVNEFFTASPALMGVTKPARGRIALHAYDPKLHPFWGETHKLCVPRYFDSALMPNATCLLSYEQSLVAVGASTHVSSYSGHLTKEAHSLFRDVTGGTMLWLWVSGCDELYLSVRIQATANYLVFRVTREQLSQFLLREISLISVARKSPDLLYLLSSSPMPPFADGTYYPTYAQLRNCMFEAVYDIADTTAALTSAALRKHLTLRASGAL